MAWRTEDRSDSVHPGLDHQVRQGSAHRVDQGLDRQGSAHRVDQGLDRQGLDHRVDQGLDRRVDHPDYFAATATPQITQDLLASH